MQGVITTGDFVAFLGYLGLLTWPMLALGWVVNIVQRGRASMQRINSLLETDAEISCKEESPESNGQTSEPKPLLSKMVPNFHHTENIPPAKKSTGKIVFDQVSFSYHEQQTPVLDNISFSIPYGKITAIAGRTGSGKTTLLSLLLRFFDPDEGSIFAGEHNLRSVPLSCWRKNIGYVPQDNFIFSTTVAENIAFARPDASMEEIRLAASLAALEQEIERFPQGFNTPIGERGVTLSGGQQQRLSLARAILVRPDYLVLDDALSSVDISTEEKILANLSGPEFPCTLVIVSHRLKVFAAADKIVVLEKGRLVEEGTHEKLFRQRSFYYRLCEDQYWEEMMR